MTLPRGQALVEFALILPIFLLLIVGTFQIGIALMVRYELVHAATEAAIAGAAEPAQPQRCDTTLAVLAEVYGRTPDDATCAVTGTSLEVRAGVAVPVLLPMGGDGWSVGVSARAEVRR